MNWCTRFTADDFGVCFQCLLRDQMFEIKTFLRKKPAACATHQQLIASNLRNETCQIAAHFVPKPLLNGRLHHLYQVGPPFALDIIHRDSHMTKGRVEVITSVERRRRWSSAEKQQLVSASLEPGASVSAVAREAGIQTAKLNDVDPQAWLADVLARIADHKINDLAALLPWNWRLARIERAA